MEAHLLVASKKDINSPVSYVTTKHFLEDFKDTSNRSIPGTLVGCCMIKPSFFVIQTISIAAFICTAYLCALNVGDGFTNIFAV